MGSTPCWAAAPDLNTGFEYLKKLDANVLNYAKENSYNDLLRGEIPSGSTPMATA
jgi:hypothetical protein